MQHDASDSVVGVDDNVLAAVAGLLPELPNLRAEIPDRFAQAVRALIECRAQAGWPGEANDDVGVFVMVDRPRELGAKLGAVPVVDPVATHDPLLGKLFLLNPDASAGRCVALPCKPSEMLEWLADNDLGGRPIVFAYRATKKMTTRPRGVDDRAWANPIRDHPPSATIEQLLEALEHFHTSKLLTPSCCADGVWEPKRAHQYVPGPQPERSIQKALEFALNFWFHGVVKAEVEDSTNIGRIDVRLLKASEDGPLAYWTIIELKIIKSFANASGKAVASEIGKSENIAAIIEGFKQAWAYRENRKAEEGLLEVFDLRRKKTEDLFADQKVINAVALLTPVPRHNVRPIFGAAKHARTAGFSGA